MSKPTLRETEELLDLFTAYVLKTVGVSSDSTAGKIGATLVAYEIGISLSHLQAFFSPAVVAASGAGLSDEKFRELLRKYGG